MSRKISSPAYMLPNNRMPCDTVLATNSTICIAKLNGYSAQWLPNGAVKLVDPAADALDLDVCRVQADQQHRHRQPHRDRQVPRSARRAGRRAPDRAGGAEDLGPDRRQQIDRQQVHRIEQEDPDEHRQAPAATEFAALGVVDDAALGLAVHHLDGDLDRGLEAPERPTSPCARPASSQAADHASVTEMNTESQLTMLRSTSDLGFTGAEVRQVVVDDVVPGARRGVLRGIRFCGHIVFLGDSCSRGGPPQQNHRSCSGTVAPTSRASQLRSEPPWRQPPASPPTAQPSRPPRP